MGTTRRPRSPRSTTLLPVSVQTERSETVTVFEDPGTAIADLASRQSHREGRRTDRTFDVIDGH